MPVSHALSEKAIKKLGLDTNLEKSKRAERVPVKEWDSSEAYCFGDFCTEACDQGYELYISDYLKKYHEDWQKDFYLHLICNEIKREEKREVQAAELAEIKKELEL